MSRKQPAIVLVTPEIPGNTGTIGRTCLALNMRLILIRPYGFSLEEKAIRRAGLDYWKHIQLTEYNSWQEFKAAEHPATPLALSARSPHNFFSYKLHNIDYLIFGPESSGLPKTIQAECQTAMLPILNNNIRSLNLANCVTTCCYEVYRQLTFVAQN